MAQVDARLVIVNIKKYMDNPTIVSIVATISDGSTVTLFPVPVATPAQTSIVDEKITLSDGTQMEFIGGAWTTVASGTAGSVPTSGN